MPLLELALAGVLLVALTFYALLGGADFGAGVWDLLAFGPRRQAQHALIVNAISPIWEANHVWLILVIVILFNAFPPAFAAISTALYIPLTIMLMGVVLRGAAFVFRSYGAQTDDVQRWWGRLFAIASIVTPVMLGVCVGAISAGRIRVENGTVTTGYMAPWFAPFPLSVGGFALVIFVFLAAVYLTVEADEPGLRDDFRLRALLAAVAVGAMALLVFLLSGEGAPRIRAGFVGLDADIVFDRVDVDGRDPQVLPGLADDSCDVLCVEQVLHGLPRLSVALTNWVRVVRPGGLLAFTVPEGAPSNGQAAATWRITVQDPAPGEGGINMFDLLQVICHLVEVERVAVHRAEPRAGRADGASGSEPGTNTPSSTTECQCGFNRRSAEVLCSTVIAPLWPVTPSWSRCRRR